jgi:small subunit ribosomal protein S7
MRGKQAKLRHIDPDHKFKSAVVGQFINYIMLDGKKSVAEKIVYDAITKLAEKAKMGEMESFNKALDNIKPKIELRSRRVGGANYQVPVPVSESRQAALAMRWIIKAAKEGRGSSDFSESLAMQLWNSFNKEGSAYKKREEVHKMAEANRAFSHLNW